MCAVRFCVLADHCPSADDPMTTAVETDCAGKTQNGASALLFANGGGASGNLCQVDCANRGRSVLLRITRLLSHGRVTHSCASVRVTCRLV